MQLSTLAIGFAIGIMAVITAMTPARTINVIAPDGGVRRLTASVSGAARLPALMKELSLAQHVRRRQAAT